MLSLWLDDTNLDLNVKARKIGFVHSSLAGERVMSEDCNLQHRRNKKN